VPEDAVYFALNNAGRRQLIRRLGMDRTGLTSSEAGGAGRKGRDVNLKHLTLLARLGIVQTATDSRDARKTRYTLLPSFITRRTETGWELDFGCTVMRWVA
jgi:hypothetical protein